MNANINVLRGKILTNPPLHDGLMSLIYEHIKFHYVGKFIDVKGMVEDKEESEDSRGFYKTKGSEGMHSTDDDVSPRSKGKGTGSTSKAPVKSPKKKLNVSLGKKKGKKVMGFDDDYFREDKDIETNVEEEGYSRKKNGKGLQKKQKKDSPTMNFFRILMTKKHAKVVLLFDDYDEEGADI